MIQAPLLALLAALAGPSAPDTTPRAQRPFAVWADPQLFFHGLGSNRAGFVGSDMSAFPLGIEVGRQLGDRVLLSASFAYRPWKQIEARMATLGGRWYLTTGLLAPYLAAELGWKREATDDTGGRTHDDLFAAAGPGVELALGSGLSFTTDLLLGPEDAGDPRSSGRTWYLSAFYRVGLGYRF